LFSKSLDDLEDLPYSAQEQRQEALARAGKMSIQGVQPKISARLNVRARRMDVVDTGGDYILKPQTLDYPELPENEDLTMHLAAMAGIEVPLHALLYSKDGSMTYCVKRFDRMKKNQKVPLEDFAQLSGMNRETKYNSSMERVMTIIETYCTFPVLEAAKLFQRTIFSFLIGNEDMHLKNFSLITRNGRVELSPAYDLLNSTIAMKGAVEELALPLAGKKHGFTEDVFIQYFGRERLGLPKNVVDDRMQVFKKVLLPWHELISVSFLSESMKQQYHDLVDKRAKRMSLAFRTNDLK
jgi:serine/threonine-protein kinase HipA